MNKVFYILSGALTVAVILPLVYLGVTKTSPVSVPEGTPLFRFHVEQGGKNEFGSLSAINALQPTGGRGGGGSDGANPVALGTPEAMSATYATEDMKMIAPPEGWNPVQYDYVFEGELPALTPNVTVYKRDQSPMSVAFSRIASSFNLGSVNLNSFGGGVLESFNIAQNVPYGYNVMVNMRDASVAINAQWDQWPMSKCQTEACYVAQRVKLSDVPSDEEAIRIAKAFIEAHDIDLTAYGEPEVDSSWRREYDRATDKANAYVPDTVRVVFPLMIDGKPVHDQSGSKAGISVGVHSKERKVFDVWGIMDRSYRASDYAGVTDPEKINAFLSRVDNFPMPIDVMPLREGTESSGQTKKVTVSLGTPTLSFATFYRYDTAVSQELLVPSLIFPVVSTGNDVYRQHVVVPLTREMLDRQNPPMQIMEGAVR